MLFPKSHGIKAAAQANLCLKYYWAILVTIIIGVVHLLSNCLHRLTEPKERYKSKRDWHLFIRPACMFYSLLHSFIILLNNISQMKPPSGKLYRTKNLKRVLLQVYKLNVYKWSWNMLPQHDPTLIELVQIVVHILENLCMSETTLLMAGLYLWG